MPSPTVSIAIEGFLLHKSAAGRSRYTIRNYRTQLNRFAQRAGSKRIDELKGNDIESFFEWLRKDYRYTSVGTSKIKPRPLSPKTLRNAWAAMSSFWNWASLEFGFDNPFTMPAPHAAQQPVNPLTMEEVASLMKACRRSAGQSRRPTSKRDKALISMLLDTGIRVSELCQADIGDIDLESGRHIVSGKGSKNRFVFIGKGTKQAIWSYLAERYPSVEWPGDEPLFADRSGTYRLTRHNVRNLLNRIGFRAKVDRVHPHRFRHTFAIEFLRNGGDVFTLQQLLGHSSLEMVRNYLRLAQLDLQQAHRRASPVDNWRLR